MGGLILGVTPRIDRDKGPLRLSEYFGVGKLFGDALGSELEEQG